MEPKVTVRSRGSRTTAPAQEIASGTQPEKHGAKPNPKSPYKKVFSVKDRDQSNVIEWSSPSNPFYRPKKKSPSSSDQAGWLQVILAVGGALIVGGILGFSILSLFFSDKPARLPNSIDAHLPDREKSTEKATSQKSLPLPEMKAVMLQAGSYSKQHKAEQVVRKYRTEGLAAHLSKQKDSYHIYLGIGQVKKQTTQMAQLLDMKGIPVYIKPVSLQGAMAAHTAVHKKLPDLLRKGNQLASELIQRSSITLNRRKEVSTFPLPDQMAALQNEFVKESQRMVDQLPKQSGRFLSEMMRALDQAVQTARSAKDNPNTALMWQIQEGLLRYVIAYQQLTTSLDQG